MLTGIDPELIRKSLYDPAFEHDGCGVGFVADVSGKASYRITDMAIQSVVNLTHRGAVDADAKTGDGAGILTQLPRKLLSRELSKLGKSLRDPSDLAVAMVFLPSGNGPQHARAKVIVEAAVREHGMDLLAWRVVPVDKSVLGDKAAATQPDIQQALIGRGKVSHGAFERTLYLARKVIEARAEKERLEGLYLPSMSSRTIVYKGLLVAPQLRTFYLDLQDHDFETALAMFHQRYSTNTFPNWFLAQPFRTLAHNGEINTLQGNVNWMHAREPELRSSTWGQDIEKLKPVVLKGGSDSANLDNAAELLMQSGRDIRHVMMMLVPEAWENMPDMDPVLKAFYEYHACLTEPWDGPASLAFSDGIVVGACLDRNGLRPARYKVTDDGIVHMASEVGVVDFDDAHVIEKGRLGPGEAIAVDVKEGVFYRNEDIKAKFASRQPYQQWVGARMVRLAERIGAAGPNGAHREPEDLVKLQKAFGYSAEELHMVLRGMILEGKDPVFSMGDDAPLAALSQKPRVFYNYFKQKFAQVTNPPIDPLREHLVMSLNIYLGRRLGFLEEGPEHAELVHLDSPLLLNHELEVLKNIHDSFFKQAELKTLFRVSEGPEGMERALKRLVQDAVKAVDAGATNLMLTDRGVDAEYAALPMLLAVGAVHHGLIRAGKRMRATLVVETAECWDIHHFAALIGYGARAVNPYLALDSIRALIGTRGVEELELEEAVRHFKTAVDNGLLKIMSKMGISTVTGYHGAQIFEAIGLNDEVIDLAFVNTPSRVGGIGLKDIARDVLARHQRAFAPPNNGAALKLEDYGLYRFRKDGEYHAYNPFTVRAFHKAVRGGTFDDFKAYTKMTDERAPSLLRDLLRFKSDRPPLSIDEVEPISSITRRFNTTAMSLGALSPEAHKTLAIAMNRLGSKSNTGEGGEDPDWYHPFPGGDWANSKIKQVASARFGVAPEYLARAEQLEIKMAQGSKPGEGGQLPGHKVAPHIAKIRHAVPGIPLISPPPHHDIYSIEDLAQLIYDLKMVNPRAKVGVKLVSEAGVGTIAAGVAKAYADVILVSGETGGTGASPLSSIKNAGVPWELGISETQQVLVLNDLRGRVVLRTDGGLRTGRDVVIAAMLGAEEYGFGTAAVVSIGCDMARQCHLNTCPTGVATQRDDLRAKFEGKPEQAIAYFTYLAQEVREILAGLGFRSMDEIIGQVHLLRQDTTPSGSRAHNLDLARILADVDPEGRRARRHTQERNDRVDAPLDDIILKDVQDALERKQRVVKSYQIRNTNRTVGARVAGALALKHTNEGLPEGTIELRFTGTAGQSFGAFAARGMRLVLTGEANDYTAKGLGGGEVIVKPPKHARFKAAENVIVGNTVLYGATDGYLFIAGRAGERFAVRNSGATAVVEGAGDHCCEYMTRGAVIVLGETGRNFGAGMTNGVAYVLDEKDDFKRKYNNELVGIDRVTGPEDVKFIQDLLRKHVEYTESEKAQEVLRHWDRYRPLFWKVEPHSARDAKKAGETLEAGAALQPALHAKK